jgi:hypothetical protein
MVHEVVNFLGALTAEGNTIPNMVIQRKSEEMLMHVRSHREEIPYSAVTRFNYGYLDHLGKSLPVDLRAP